VPDLGPLVAAFVIYMAVTAALTVMAAGHLRVLARRHYQKHGLPAEDARPSHALPLVLRVNPDRELEVLRKRAFRPLAGLVMMELTFLAAVMVVVIRTAGG
jgi:hypothetical protein